MNIFHKLILTVSIVSLLASCSTNNKVAESASSKRVADKIAQQEFKTNSNEALNKRILQSASLNINTAPDSDYRLGSGDIIEITVFQVNELNTKARVNGRGSIILPLLGTIDVKGKTISEVEEELIRKLSQEYLQNPQVSIFIDEYRSQQITVMGAVTKPNVYNVRQSRSVFEMLSMAGGLTEEASDKVRIRTTQLDGSTGEQKQVSLVVSMQDMLQGNNGVNNLRLSGGDSVMIPEAGVVFVEGAVKKPGAFKLEGNVNVLKAIALAGGTPWEAQSKGVQVVRVVDGEPISIKVNLEDIKQQKGDDIVLQDGDVVVVGFDVAKRAFSGFFKTFGSIFGYSLN